MNTPPPSTPESSISVAAPGQYSILGGTVTVGDITFGGDARSNVMRYIVPDYVRVGHSAMKLWKTGGAATLEDSLVRHEFKRNEAEEIARRWRRTNEYKNPTPLPRTIRKYFEEVAR